VPGTGTCTGTWTAGTGTGTGTCDKVLVAKTKSFSAVIDTLWHLYSETETECLDYWFLADRTNGRAIGTVLRLSVCLSVCDVMYWNGNR